MKRFSLLLISHLIVGMAGFALGIYALPILTAPEGPSVDEVMKTVGTPSYQGVFKRDLADSDFLHWGEGNLYIGESDISFVGELAPGPDYKLYLSPEFVETEAHFHRLKASMVQVGDIKSFSTFQLAIPEGVKPDDYTAAIVWCESFEQFITAASYR